MAIAWPKAPRSRRCSVSFWVRKRGIAVERAASLLRDETIPALIPVEIELVTKEKLEQPANPAN